jgi:hypothetical protein
LNEIEPTFSEPYLYLSSHLGIDAKLCGNTGWRPTVNGWVGSPLGAAFDIRHQQFGDFPTTDTLAWLAANSVHWIVIPDPNTKSRAGSEKRLLEVKDFPDGGLYKIKNPQQVLEQSEAERKARRTLLTKLRQSSAETISWPGTDLFNIVGGDGMKIGPEGLPVFETSETNSISAQVHFRKTMPPGLYDQFVVEYEILTGASTHNTKIYWRSDNEDMSEKRGLTGETDAVDNSHTRWTTTFNLYREKDWLEDNAVPRLRLDFYEFNSLQPVTLKIVNIKLLRKPEVPAIPII